MWHVTQSPLSHTIPNPTVQGKEEADAIMDLVLFYHPCDVSETLPEKAEWEPIMNTSDVLLSRYTVRHTRIMPAPAVLP